jgi:hypothetical protein
VNHSFQQDFAFGGEGRQTITTAILSFADHGCDTIESMGDPKSNVCGIQCVNSPHPPPLPTQTTTVNNCGIYATYNYDGVVDHESLLLSSEEG